MTLSSENYIVTVTSQQLGRERCFSIQQDKDIATGSKKASQYRNILQHIHTSIRRNWIWYIVVMSTIGVMMTMTAGQWNKTVGHSGYNSPHTGTRRAPVPYQLPYNCKCRSVFTIGACDLDGVVRLRPGDNAWENALTRLDAARKNQEVAMMPQLATLARYLPQVFNLRINAENEEPKFYSEVTRASPELPFLPCQLHVYKPSEVLDCTTKRLAATSKPLYIAFVGDSRVRNTMQQMIRGTLGWLDWRVLGKNNTLDPALNFLDTKSHNNVPVIGKGVELRLHWSAFLDHPRNPNEESLQGARDLLENWVMGKEKPLPNVVYVTSGMWDTSMEGGDVAVEEFMHTLDVMAPILIALARHTRVLWHIHAPIKPWAAPGNIPNTALDMMNSVAWAKLGNSDVWMWDSNTVLMLRAHSECQNLLRSGLIDAAPHTWGCTDYQHAGRDVEHASANMMWNLVCNSVIELPHNHCCTH